MKKWLCCLLVAVLLILSMGGLSVSAIELSNDMLEFEIVNGTAIVTGPKNGDHDGRIKGQLTIPSTIGGFPVTAIEAKALMNCPYLTDVTIPNSIKIIGDNAFYGCQSLKKVTIPDSVTAIGKQAFSCEMIISSNNSSYSSMDGVLFNREQSTLICYPQSKIDTSYTIPNSVITIASKAFADCNNLCSITIPGSVSIIRERAFDSCKNLSTLVMQDGITTIEEDAFFWCTALQDVSIPGSVDTIADSAFYGCQNLTSVTIQPGVNIIDNTSFRGCSNLTSVIIPDSVTEIRDRAFEGCDKLTTVTIPNPITTLGFYAFGYLDDVMETASPNFSMRGLAGSTTEQYCIENGIPFTALTQEQMNTYLAEKYPPQGTPSEPSIQDIPANSPISQSSVQPATTLNQGSTPAEESFMVAYSLWFIIGGLLLLLIIGFVLFLVLKKKSRTYPPAVEDEPGVATQITTCPNCGASITPNAVFCGKCGHSLR